MNDLQLRDRTTHEAAAQATGDLPFRCPSCGGTIVASGEALACSSCKTSYARRDGIYDFRVRRHDYYFNPVPRAEMAAMVAEAPSVDWDDTVRHFLRFTRNPSSWIDNIAVNGRYTWKLFLELPPHARFLDFGCGLGNMTQNVAPHVGEVVALDLTWERLLFAQQRFAKFNAGSRITLVAGGDGPRLPFPDAHFDCIALSGVLEWIADDDSAYAGGGSRVSRAMRMLMSFFGETNPRRTQRRFLEELRRILKPDGQLFVAIENRWNYEYFTGRPDHHSGLKYGSLLPRFVANAYSIVRSRRPYRTYTYALPQFRRLFADAGFAHQECLGLSPGYSGLRRVVPYEADTPGWRTPAPDVATRIKRSRYFVPAFGMVARRTAQRRPSLLARLLAEVEAGSPELRGIELAECFVTGKDKVVLVGNAGGRDVILKLPAGPLAQAGEDANHRMLVALSKHPTLARIAPQPLAAGTFQGVCYFVESAVRGKPIGMSATAFDREAAAQKVAALLESMHAVVDPATRIAPDDAAYRFLLGEAVGKLRKAGVEAARCDALERRLADALVSQPWVLGPQHGDFARTNVFVDDERTTGVIDWEYGSLQGLPVLDAIVYMESVERMVAPKQTMQQNIERLRRWEWSSPQETAMLRTLYRRFGVDESLHGFLCELAWLSHMAHQLDTTARFDRRFLDTRLAAMVTALAG